MVLDIINKVLLVIFVLSLLNVGKHSFNVVRFYFNEMGKYAMTSLEVLLLGLSLSYIITAIISGIYI